MNKGMNATRQKPGDAAVGNPYPNHIWTDYDNLYGAVLPHFWFLRLVPEPVRDDNEAQDASDSLFLSDWVRMAETYLFAMCSGYVDGATTKAYACQTGVYTLFDYTFSNLCYEAFGNRWINQLPKSIRHDNLEGHGPLPNTEAYAEIFAQLAKAVNLLTRVRVEAPYSMTCGANYYYAQIPIPPNWPPSAPQNCFTGHEPVIWYGSPPAPVTLYASDAPGSCPGQFTAHSLAFIMSTECAGNNFKLRSEKKVASFSIALTDADFATYAIPPIWSDMLSTRLGALVSITHQTHTIHVKDAPPTTVCGGHDFAPHQFTTQLDVSWTACDFLVTGTVDLGVPPTSWFVHPCDEDTLTYFVQHSRSYDIIPGSTLYLDIPLSDPPAD